MRLETFSGICKADMHNVLRAQRNQRDRTNVCWSDYEVTWPKRFRSFKNHAPVQYVLIRDVSRGGEWVLYSRHVEGIPGHALRALKMLFQKGIAMDPVLIKQAFDAAPDLQHQGLIEPEPEKAESLW